MNTHATIKDESKEKLEKRIEQMEDRGYELEGEIVPQSGYNGIIHYAKLKWCGTIE